VLCPGRDGSREISAAVVDVILESGRRAGDLTVADVPRYPTAAGDRMIETADVVVLLTTSDIRGSYSAGRVARRLTELGALPELVVRGPSPGGIGAEDIGDALGLPVVARMRPQPSLARDLENARPPGSDTHGPLVRAANAVLARLSARYPG
jgi:Flp pilus assembly CpaE family ATPase